MINKIKKMFGMEASPEFAQLLKEGAIVIDVRSKSEYAAGHIKGSMNIPVDVLQSHLDKLKDKNKTIITCCASGMRSSAAKGILKSKGYLNVFNGGGWQSLNQKLNK